LTNNLKSNTVKAATWNFSKVVVSQVRNFVVSTTLARLLLPADFGLLGMAMIFAGFAGSFVDFGFGNAVIQKQKVSDIQLSTIFWLNNILAVFLGAIMFLTAPFVAKYFEMAALENITRIMSLTFVIKGLTTLQESLFRKELNYKTLFKVEITSGIISGVIGIYMAYNGFGVYSLIYSQICGWLITTTLIWIFSSWKPSFTFNLKEVQPLWSFGYKYSLSVFIDSIFSRLDTIIIGKLFSASILGVFYKAQSLLKLVVYFAFNSLSGVLFPSLSKLNNDTIKLKNATYRILHIVCFTTFLLSGLMYISADSIIIFLYTAKWSGSIPIFKLIVSFAFIITIPPILNAPVLSLGRSDKTLKVEIIKKSLYLFTIPIAIYFNLYYYIFSTIVAACLGMLLNATLLVKYVNFNKLELSKLFFSYLIPFVLISGCFTLFPFHIKNHFVNIVAQSLVYVFMYYIINFTFKNRGLSEVIEIINLLLSKFVRKIKPN